MSDDNAPYAGARSPTRDVKDGDTSYVDAMHPGLREGLEQTAENEYWSLFERHWNCLRNVFPQFLRCQEKEDEVTDNYADALGPRSLGPLERNGCYKSALPTDVPVEFEHQEEEYRKKLLPRIINPQWEYKKDMMRDNTPFAPNIRDLKTRFPGVGRSDALPEGLQSPNLVYDPNFNKEAFLRGRYLKSAVRLPEKENDGPLESDQYSSWREALNSLREKASLPPEERAVRPEDLVPGVPFLDRTRDKYEIITWSWMRRRLKEEDEQIAKQGLRLFVLIIFQMAFGAIIWGLGAEEIDGGRLEVVIASFFVGVVSIISGFIGLIGVVAENELFLRRFWIAQLWMLSLLVAFLYTEAHHITENYDVCNQSLANLVEGTDTYCEEKRDVGIAALIFCLLELLLGYISVYMCTALLDAINDRTSIDDSMQLFKYFQYYLNELLKRAGVKETGITSSEYIHPLEGPDWFQNEDGMYVTLEDMAEEKEVAGKGKE